MASIESRKGCDRHPLSGGHHRRVDGSERKVAVAGHELGDPEPIGWGDRLGEEVPGRQVAEESDLGFHSRSGREEVRHFRDDELGNDERAGV